MNRTEYLLTKLAEEGAEVAQRATKALTFGLAETQPGQDQTNAQRLRGELVDLMAIWLMLDRHLEIRAHLGELPFFALRDDGDALDAKMEKVEHYAEYSRALGCLTDGRSSSPPAKGRAE